MSKKGILSPFLTSWPPDLGLEIIQNSWTTQFRASHSRGRHGGHPLTSWIFLSPAPFKQILEKTKYWKLLFISVFHFLYLLFGCLMANFGSLRRGQLHSPYVNHCFFFIKFNPNVTWRLVTSPFLGPPIVPRYCPLTPQPPNFEEFSSPMRGAQLPHQGRIQSKFHTGWPVWVPKKMSSENKS